MHILITGGTGLLGQAFIRRFNTHQLTVLTRSIATSMRLFDSTVQLIDSLEHLPNLDAFDAVINLAGEPIINKRWSEKQKNVICQSRWQITEQLVALFARSANPPAVLLSGSAVGVYGNRGEALLTETDVAEVPGFPVQVCVRWEQIARQAEPYTRVVLLRTGIVLDPQGGALGKMLLPFKWGLGGRIGTGQQYMPWIHYQDYLQAMDHLLTASDIAGAVNLVAPGVVTNQRFTQVLAEVLHRPAILPMPQRVLKLMLGESSCLLLDSQRVVPQTLLAHGFAFKFPELQEALTDLLPSSASQSLE